MGQIAFSQELLSIAETASSARTLAANLKGPNLLGATRSLPTNRPALPAGRNPLWELVAPGSMVELSGRAPGKLSTAARLVARAQGQGEPVAWVSLREAPSFYPPDFGRVGVDLASLVMVRVPRLVPLPGNAASTDPKANDARKKLGGVHGLVRAVELLLRSGAFGLVVLDLTHEIPPSVCSRGTPTAAQSPLSGEQAWQSRLSGLVRMHDARLVLLTSVAKEKPSLGPLVSLRIAPDVRIEAEHISTAPPTKVPQARAVLTQQVLKAKLGHVADASPDVRALPEGL